VFKKEERKWWIPFERSRTRKGRRYVGETIWASGMGRGSFGEKRGGVKRTTTECAASRAQHSPRPCPSFTGVDLLIAMLEGGKLEGDSRLRLKKNRTTFKWSTGTITLEDYRESSERTEGGGNGKKTLSS